MSSLQINPNLMVQYLQKPSSEFGKEDIIRYIEEREIEMLNFRYVAEDGKLKTINFMVTGKKDLDMILSSGERVDGSSIFSFLEPNSSDLYLVPRYKTAFQNPFSEIPSVDILCSFFSGEGKPLESSPEYILQKAVRRFFKETGLKIKMMGELEYYVISQTENTHPLTSNGYQCSEPFTAHENLRKEAIKLIARCGGKVRFAHSETGRFQIGNEIYEQHEIEFTAVEPEDAADQLLIAKWILRMLGQKYGVKLTFIPKISLDKAGSGLHYHYQIEKADKNILIENDELSQTALKTMAGILDLAPSLCAFGNTNPISYFRILPGQKAARHICWGYSNRSTLIRIPLGWNKNPNMAAILNHSDEQAETDFTFRQTIEYRGADGSSNPYLFSAAFIIAILKGLNGIGTADEAQKLKCTMNLFQQTEETIGEKFNSLPMSCHEAAEKLEENRSIFEEDNVFTKTIINHMILKLRSFKDKEFSTNFITYGENQEFKDLVKEYMNYM